MLPVTASWRLPSHLGFLCASAWGCRSGLEVAAWPQQACAAPEGRVEQWHRVGVGCGLHRVTRTRTKTAKIAVLKDAIMLK